MNILLWHVHGAWTNAFVQGGHTYLLPVTPGRGPYGLGRARTYQWPADVVEVPAEDLAAADVDVVILQRPEEREIGDRWLRRQIGRDVPAVFVEHNTPRGDVPDTRHPMSNQDGLVLVQVTHFNALMWDCGRTRTTVIEHGIPLPASRYSGELPRLAVACNEPVRRWRVTGTDLLADFAQVAPLDVYGMGLADLARRTGIPPDRLTAHEDPPQVRMHAELARRRAYLHLTRWTSLGLSLLEAMAMGLPVLALATTEAVAAVPPDAGVLDTRVQTLRDAAAWLVSDPDAARRLGARGRAATLRRYGLDRFLADWDQLLKEVLQCA